MLGIKLLICAIMFAFLDLAMYCIAPYPQRTKWYYKHLPGGGIAAFFLLWRGNKL